jgi:hypothetical protein
MASCGGCHVCVADAADLSAKGSPSVATGNDQGEKPSLPGTYADTRWLLGQRAPTPVYIRMHARLKTAAVVAKTRMGRNSLRKSAHLDWCDAKSRRPGRPAKRLCLFVGRDSADAFAKRLARMSFPLRGTTVAKKPH